MNRRHFVVLALFLLIFGPGLFADSVEEQDGSGLVLQTDPPGAEVYIDGISRGFTPLTLPELVKGRYAVRLRKEGYIERRVRLTIPDRGRLLVALDMKRATGEIFIKVSPKEGSPLPAVLPLEPKIYVDGRYINTFYLTLAEGFRTIRVRAFGWEDVNENIYISRNYFQTVDIVMTPASFRILDSSVQRPRFNPANSGNLGKTEFRFSVSGPGQGSVRVYDEAGNEVFHKDVGPFTDWSQSVAWDGRDMYGAPLPEGIYRAVIETESFPHDASPPVSSAVNLEARIDNSINIVPASLSSAASGTFFAPLPAILPAGSYQIEGSLLFGFPYPQAAERQEEGRQEAARAWRSLPLSMGIRFSVMEKLELAAAFNAVPEIGTATPISFGGGVKWPFFTGPLGAFALGARYAWSKEGTESPFGFISGPEIFLPAALKLGAGFTLSVCPALAWPGPNGLPERAVPLALLSGSAVFEKGFVSAGFSGRTEFDFTGQGLEKTSLALELKLYPPPSSLVFTLLSGAWIENSRYGFFGGLGFGAIY